MPENYFPPLSVPSRDTDYLRQWLKSQTISFQKVITGSLQAGQELSSDNYAAGSTGWQIDGDGNAEFNGVTVRGDIVSSNWDGADPADLSAGPDTSATAGFYFDASAGAAQFTGPVYFQPPNESTEGSGTTFSFGDGFEIRVYQDNPTTGEDTLWFLASTDATDHMVLGPASASNELKSLTLKALSIPLDFGSWSHSLPKGIIYDFGVANTAAGGTLNTYPTDITGLSATVNVPSGVSVTILAWAWSRMDLTLDQEWAALQIDIAGTVPINPALIEQDLSAGATSGGPSSSSTGNESASHQHGLGVNSYRTNLISGHRHQLVADSGEITGSHNISHSHSMQSHTHSVSIALSQSFKTLSYHALRSFTPGGSTVTVKAQGGTSGSNAQVYDDGALIYMVLVN